MEEGNCSILCVFLIDLNRRWYFYMAILLQLVAWIQSVADPRQNSRIGKVFALAEPRFLLDVEHNFRVIFPYHDWNRILNPWLVAYVCMILKIKGVLVSVHFTYFTLSCGSIN